MRTSIALPLDLGSAVAARAYIERALNETIERDVLEDARLLVNELVTNSVKHCDGSGQVTLTVSTHPQRVRVEVHDPGSGFTPPTGHPDLSSTSGRGLFLVDRLSDRWGVSNDGLTCVWFELDRSGA